MDFNHIDKNIKKEELDEIITFYKTYQQLHKRYKTSYKKFKLKSISLTLIAICLVSAGTIAGAITLNPIILGTITGAGVMVGAFQKKKDYESKIEMSKYTFQLYEKTLINLRSAARSGVFDRNMFIQEMQILDAVISDLCPAAN